MSGLGSRVIADAGTGSGLVLSGALSLECDTTIDVPIDMTAAAGSLIVKVRHHSPLMLRPPTLPPALPTPVSWYGPLTVR